MLLLRIIFLLPRLIFWFALILLVMWFVRSLQAKKKAPAYVGIPEINQLFKTESNGERKCREVLEDLYGVPFPKESNMFRNPVTGRFLELDGVNKDMRLAFEYQGKHHYNDLKQAQRDVIKRRLCDERNIYLIPVPWKIPTKKIEGFLAGLLPKTLDMFLVDDETRDYVREARKYSKET